MRIVIRQQLSAQIETLMSLQGDKKEIYALLTLR